MGKIVAVGSGCGGVGKSTIALSIAVCASRHGMNTILLDASGTSRSCDLMLGLENIVVLDMMDVVRQHAAISSALYRIPGRDNLRFACASLYEGAALSELSGILLALRAMSDLLMIDLPTGPIRIGEGVLDENDAILFLTRPDDISIRAVERMASVLPRDGAQRHLIINRIDTHLLKKKVQYPVSTVEMLLDMPSSGVISEDEAIMLAAGRGMPAIDCGLRTRAELEKLFKACITA